ncbi:MAG: fumarylacetoacetase [Aeromicrobium sp.]
MTTWTRVPDTHPFSVHALPYGSFSMASDVTDEAGPDGPSRRRVGVAIGDQVLDLTSVTAELAPDLAATFADGTMDRLLAAGRPVWSRVRAAVVDWLTDPAFQTDVERHLLPLQDVVLHLPFDVADYVDFYASEHHATNLGRMFRPDQEPLTANWKHLPIGYHGRAGTIVPSGTPVQRPAGLRRGPDGDVTFGASARLDIETELGFVVGTSSTLGTPVPLEQFDQHVFGVCLVNDWSARDIQAFEYVPLGPFLGKSFATSIGHWVLPLEALEHARVRPPTRDVPLAHYLDDTLTGEWGLDIDFEVTLNGVVVSRPPFAPMYWTAAQQLAHMTINGAALRTGDFFASGTISGPEREQRGSLIELSWGGSEPLTLEDGSTRTFLEDGDEVLISASAPGPDGTRIGLGTVRGRITPNTQPTGE